MTRFFYPAIVYKGADNHGYDITFLDVPVNSTGATWTECLLNGTEALAFFVDTELGDGQEIPKPTAWEMRHSKIDRDIQHGLVDVVPIPVDVPGKSVRVSVSLDEGLLRRIDSVAGHYGRSQFLANAARLLLSSGRQ
jgi:predicted RNase H-like HicB family nuclease